MLAENAVDPAVVTDSSHHRTTFFRQSGWMMIATVGSGAFAFAVHALWRWVGDAEYGSMVAMIAILNWMSIPALGLQLVIAHQTSAAVTPAQRRQLVGTFKAVMRWTFYIWLAMVVAVVVERTRLLANLGLSNPWSLWLVLLSGLMMLWTPLFNGLLQGRQNFLWMGWVAIINGAGRVVFAAAIVILLRGLAAGIMAGFLIGLTVAVAVAFWQNWDLWNEPQEPFDAMNWLRHVIPLSLGSGVGLFLLTADAVAARIYLGHDTGFAPYQFGGTLARAIVLFTAPLAAVMFPKLVHRKARSEKGGPDLLGLTLLGTGALAGMAAVGLSILSAILIKRNLKPDFISILPLIPLYAWAMVPLALGNVLLNNLIALSHFKVVPWLVALAAGYWLALMHFHDSFKMVIETLGVFNLIFLGVVAGFTWRQRRLEHGSSEPVIAA